MKSADKKERRTLESLPVWNRFHIRLTAVYAVAVFAVLGANSILFYHYGVQAELEALQNRLHASALVLSNALDGELVASLAHEGSQEEAAYVKVQSILKGIVDQYPGISSIYTMVPSDETGILRFAVDYTPGDAVPPGTEYDARDIPTLLQGLEKPTVEDQVIRDEYGVTLSGYAPLLDDKGQSVGLIGVDVDASRVDAIRSRLLKMSLLLLVLTTFLMFIAAWFNGRRIRGPPGACH